MSLCVAKAANDVEWVVDDKFDPEIYFRQLKMVSTALPLTLRGLIKYLG